MELADNVAVSEPGDGQARNTKDKNKNVGIVDTLVRYCGEWFYGSASHKRATRELFGRGLFRDLKTMSDRYETVQPQEWRMDGMEYFGCT